MSKHLLIVYASRAAEAEARGCEAPRLGFLEPQRARRAREGSGELGRAPKGLRGLLGTSWCHLRTPLGLLVVSWGALGPLWALLRASCGLFGLSWDLLGAFFSLFSLLSRHSIGIFGALGSSCAFLLVYASAGT